MTTGLPIAMLCWRRKTRRYLACEIEGYRRQQQAGNSELRAGANAEDQRTAKTETGADNVAAAPEPAWNS
jgi:hypothetical protein